MGPLANTRPRPNVLVCCVLYVLVIGRARHSSLAEQVVDGPLHVAVRGPQRSLSLRSHARRGMKPREHARSRNQSGVVTMGARAWLAGTCTCTGSRFASDGCLRCGHQPRDSCKATAGTRTTAVPVCCKATVLLPGYWKTACSHRRTCALVKPSPCRKVRSAASKGAASAPAASSTAELPLLPVAPSPAPAATGSTSSQADELLPVRFAPAALCAPGAWPCIRRLCASCTAAATKLLSAALRMAHACRSQSSCRQ